MKKRSEFLRLRVGPNDMKMFVSVTTTAGISQVVIRIGTAMYKWDYMFYIEHLCREIFRSFTILTVESCPLGDGEPL